MNKLCGYIKEQAEINFINLETAIKTYDRNAPVCGAPAWRYVYHTIHSADKWFINPNEYDEPVFHKQGMDNPDNPCDVVLSDEELLGYMNEVRVKTRQYIEGLTDNMLYEKPCGCQFTRYELVLLQFRHISFHTGMINGQTVERTGRFPVYSGAVIRQGLYDE